MLGFVRLCIACQCPVFREGLWRTLAAVLCWVTSPTLESRFFVVEVVCTDGLPGIRVCFVVCDTRRVVWASPLAYWRFVVDYRGRFFGGERANSNECSLFLLSDPVRCLAVVFVDIVWLVVGRRSRFLVC